MSIRGQLRPGEELLWSGRPDPDVMFTPADAFLVPFSIMWAGFAVFWEASALSSDAPGFFVLWGIPFIGMGLFFVFGRFVVKKRRKMRTTYAVTNQRAIVLVGDADISDVPIRNEAVSVKRSRDGRHGSVEFGSSGPRWGSAWYGNTGMDFMRNGWGGPWGGGPAVAFYDVSDINALQRALDRARGEA